MVWRPALRRAWRQRGSTMAVAGLLGIGIGACGATFAVVDTLLWKESAVRATEELEILWRFDPESGVPFREVSFLDCLDWRRDSETLEELACFGAATHHGVLRLNEPVPVDLSDVSASFFDVLGAEARLGRTFVAEDELPHAPRVVVLSHGLWQSQFGGNPEIVGQTVRIDGNDPDTFSVVGVMPKSFAFPSGIELWIPMRLDTAYTRNRFLAFLFMVGRRNPDVGRSEAKAELDALVRATDATYAADRGRQDEMALTPFVDYYLGAGTRPALRALSGAVALVLLIAWVNAGNLLLVRTGEEERERTIRRALGASRVDIVFRTVSTATVCTALAFPVAAAFATLAVATLIRFGPSDLPRLSQTEIDLNTLAMMAALAVVSLTLISGLGLVRTFRDGRMRPSRRGALLVGEVAVAVIVFAACGLTLRSFTEIERADPGYDTERLLMFGLAATSAYFPELDDKKAFYRLALERIRSIPLVRSAAGVLTRPFGAGSVGWDLNFVYEGQAFDWKPIEHEGHTYYLPDLAAGNENPVSNMEATTPGYFETMGIELLEGRDFRASDDRDNPHVLIVSASLAESIWPGESAVGKGLYVPNSRFDDDLRRVPSRIIGVVADAHYREIDDIRFDVYHSHAQSPIPLRHLVVRTEGDPLSVVPAIRRELRVIAPAIPVTRVTTLAHVVAEERGPWRFNAVLFAAFAAIAGFMTALGIFAVVAQSIVERRREIGVRMAIGAKPEDVVKLSVVGAMKPVLLGIAAGSAAALLLSRWVASLLYGVSATDPITYGATATLFAGVALVASYLPARRASRIDPTIVLRHD